MHLYPWGRRESLAHAQRQQAKGFCKQKPPCGSPAVWRCLPPHLAWQISGEGVLVFANANSPALDSFSSPNPSSFHSPKGQRVLTCLAFSVPGRWQGSGHVWMRKSRPSRLCPSWPPLPCALFAAPPVCFRTFCVGSGAASS